MDSMQHMHLIFFGILVMQRLLKWLKLWEIFWHRMQLFRMMEMWSEVL